MSDPIHWLLTEGPRCADPGALLGGLCMALREEGIPVERSTISAPLLHPIAQSVYARWEKETGYSNSWFVWTPENEAMLAKSPIAPIYREGRGSRISIEIAAERDRYPITVDLAAEGFTEYCAIALPFADNTYKAFTVATRRQGGFADDFPRIERIVPALAVVLEVFVSRRTAATLMDTYVGTRAGGRVLDGEIRRGDGSRIDAVVWFSDLRNFTGLSQSHEPEAMLDLLNVYYGALVDTITANGGEVLKFIGDAILAIFPVEDDAGKAADAAESAALGAIGAREAADWPADLDFGIALHRGDVFYGNIGGETRLDFTVIGVAVNLASRIEGLCSRLDQRLLVSDEVARIAGRQHVSVGAFELKGVDGATRVHTVSDIDIRA